MSTDSLTARLRRPSRTMLVGALVALLLVASGVAFQQRLLPWQDDEPDVDEARTAALASARTAATTLTTLDAAAPDASIEAWSDVTTGDLREAVATGEADFQQLITSGGYDTSSTVQEAAVATIDAAAGTAEVLVAIDVALTPADGRPSTELLSLGITVDRTEDGWKASALAPVARGATIGGGSDAIATDVAAAMVSLWSYDHRKLAGVDAVASVTTPDFLDEYAATYAEIERLAPQTKAVVKAEVTGIATLAVDGDRATVLVFLAQQARKGKARPTIGQTRLRVAVEKVDGHWVVDQATTV